MASAGCCFRCCCWLCKPKLLGCVLGRVVHESAQRNQFHEKQKNKRGNRRASEEQSKVDRHDVSTVLLLFPGTKCINRNQHFRCQIEKGGDAAGTYAHIINTTPSLSIIDFRHRHHSRSIVIQHSNAISLGIHALYLDVFAHCRCLNSCYPFHVRSISSARPVVPSTPGVISAQHESGTQSTTLPSFAPTIRLAACPFPLPQARNMTSSVRRTVDKLE